MSPIKNKEREGGVINSPNKVCVSYCVPHQGVMIEWSNRFLFLVVNLMKTKKG